MLAANQNTLSSSMSRFTSICDDGLYSTKAEVLAGTLAWALRIGVPESIAIEMLKKQFASIWDTVTPSRYCWERCLHKVALDLMEGKKLSWSLRLNMRFLLPEFFLLAVEKAEEDGKLLEALEILAARMNYTRVLKRQYANTLFLPIVEFIGISIFSLFFLMRFRFWKAIALEMIGDDLSGLPMISHFLLYINQIVLSACFATEEREIITVFLISSAPLLFLLIVMLWRDKYFKALRLCLLQRTMMILPFFSRCMKDMAMLELSAAMATFTALGQDVITSAEWCMKSTNYGFLRKRLKIFIEKTSNGCNWLDAWEKMNLGTNKDNWVLRNAADRESVSEGFETLMKSKRYEISVLTRIFMFFIQLGSLAFNTCIVLIIALGIGGILLNIIYASLSL